MFKHIPLCVGCWVCLLILRPGGEGACDGGHAFGSDGAGGDTGADGAGLGGES